MTSIGSRRLSKVAVAVGGFLIFVGVIILGVFALVLTGVLKANTLERIFMDYRMLCLGALLAIGVLNVVSGIILRHR